MLLPEPGSGINNSGAAGHSLAKILPIPKVLQLSVWAAVYYSIFTISTSKIRTALGGMTPSLVPASPYLKKRSQRLIFTHSGEDNL